MKKQKRNENNWEKIKIQNKEKSKNKNCERNSNIVTEGSKTRKRGGSIR